jgi:hypothetical protein
VIGTQEKPESARCPGDPTRRPLWLKAAIARVQVTAAGREGEWRRELGPGDNGASPA